ncbi:hypothetical protein ACFQ1I_05050 [Kitasatospora arboriphila]
MGASGSGGAGAVGPGRRRRGGGPAAHLPPPPGEDELPHRPDGLARLLTSAGLREARCETLRWQHRTGADEWWSGPANGVGFLGQVLLSRDERTRAEARRHFDTLSREFLCEDGLLALPHAALLVSARR